MVKHQDDGIRSDEQQPEPLDSIAPEELSSRTGSRNRPFRFKNYYYNTANSTRKAGDHCLCINSKPTKLNKGEFKCRGKLVEAHEGDVTYLKIFKEHTNECKDFYDFYSWRISYQDTRFYSESSQGAN